jgi:hypothetical protein
MTILPQFQGDAYTLQNKAALAQALMQQSFQPQNTQAVGSGQYTIVPKYSALGGLAQLGQALVAARMQNDVAQGYQGLGQNQWAALTGSPASGGMGGSGAGSSASGSSPQALASALGGGGSSGQAAPQQGGLLSPGGPLNPNGIPTAAAAQMYLSGPEGQKELFKSVTSAFAPTPATMAARQGGFDPAQANQKQFAKDSYVAPITGTGIMRNPFNPSQPVAFNPEIPAGAQPLFDASGNVAKVQPIQGAQGVIQGNAAASAAGGAQFKPVQVYNPQTQQMEYSNEAQVTNPTAPAGIRNNNPGAMMPGGKLAQYPDMQTGLAALDGNLASYGKQGVNTVAGVISKWAPPNENDTQAYIKDVSQRLGIPPNQKIDLTNPLQRQALSTAIALHENGPSGVFGGGGAAAPSARPAASAPMGAQANAEATAKGQVETMQKSYGNLQNLRQGGPAALQDLDNMMGLAAGKSPATVGPYVASMAGLVSSNAAEYEKSRDNLVTNLGSQLGISSDAAREMVYGSIPSYGAPKQAIANGLATLKSQVQTRMLKSDFLSDAYSAGDAKAYNQRENQFDQNMTPKISGIVAMPSGPQRAAALQAAAKDPNVRSRLEWAASNGILK